MSRQRLTARGYLKAIGVVLESLEIAATYNPREFDLYVSLNDLHDALVLLDDNDEVILNEIINVYDDDEEEE